MNGVKQVEMTRFSKYIHALGLDISFLVGYSFFQAQTVCTNKQSAK